MADMTHNEQVQKHILEHYGPDALTYYDKHMTPSHDDPFFEFEGWNCHDWDDGCSGWDGFSRRCECGNRRVSWEWDMGMLYGQAY